MSAAVSTALAHERLIQPLGGYRARGLAPAEEVVFYGHAPGIDGSHPDASLLALCAHLRTMQTRWQQRWEATSDDGNAGTPADRQFDDFADQVWPGYKVDQAGDVVRPLLTMRATTLEGMRAKAAAITAILEAGRYSSRCRDDELELMASFLVEAAGGLVMPLGEQAEKRA